MPTLYAAIGPAGSRKSSLIRSLTGIGNRHADFDRNILDIQLATGAVAQVYCCSPALQEIAIDPATFIAAVQQQGSRATDVAIALRRAPAQGCPGCIDYLQAWLNVGWSIGGIVLLGAGHPVAQHYPGTPQIQRFPNSLQTPTNEMAAQVRNAWGWR